jgi:hypothetical protein
MNKGTADAADKLNNKISQLVNDAAKEILTIVEADFIGRNRELADVSDKETYQIRSDSLDKEFQFLRKRVLDSLNNVKRTVTLVLGRFEIKEPEGMTFRVTSGSDD